MNRDEIKSFFSQKNYDIRISKNARWIDQKCTFDVVCMVADCIVEFIDTNCNKSFHVRDIWLSQYAIDNVVEIFSKPSPDNKKAKNEYDKYFGQPIKLLAYCGILLENRTRSPYSYQVLNLSLLKHIALREKNALDFLILYIEKVLVDSGLMGVFDNFFCKQTEDSYAILKQTFTEFTIQHTKINKTLECGRIFTKVLNPLAYIRQKRGTERGHLSATLITQNDLRYNRENWRDQQSGKSKNIVRSDFEVLLSNHYGNYKIQKAKRIVREFNNLYRKSLSEVCEDNEKNPATQIHHIFPASTYPKIADFLENLIALTPNQHNLKAHPKNRTREIDRDFQYVCLLAKTHSIWENLVCNTKQEKIYDFDDYRYVLNIGFDTEEFNSIGEYDFLSLLDKIDKYYDVDNNKYHKLIELNYLGAN